VKFYLFLVAIVIAIACIWGMTTLRHTTHQMVDHSRSVNEIINEAAR